MKPWHMLVGSFSLALTAPAAWAVGADAVVEWSRRVELSVPVSGVIAQVSVESGDRVKRDQILLALDDAPFKAALTQAQALLTLRKSESREAGRDLKQAQELYARTVLSTVDFENAKNKYERAQAGQQAASAALDVARWRLRVSAIRAPYDGMVIQRLAQPGQTVAAELKPQTLLVFAAADEYIARAHLPAESVAGLSAGQSASVIVTGEKLPAKVKRIGLEPLPNRDEANPQYEVEVVFASPKSLRAGLRVTIDLP
jgi:RND family efflux transporter MFP subunit